MKHFGDITKLSGNDLPIVDIITGGSPCQDLSVAKTNRDGLAGQRSGLFIEQIRIVKEMRARDVRENGRSGFLVRPRYMVWENVPGAFTSGNPKGSDFAAVIEEIIKVCEPTSRLRVCVPDRGWSKSGCYYASDGRWSIAWTVHNAADWGVPQRRLRISLVADFGGLSAPEILFERKGLSWNIEQSEAKRERTSNGTDECSGKASGFPLGFRPENVKLYDEKATTICNGTRPGHTCGVLQEQAQPILLESNQNHATVQTNGISTALPASMGMGGGYIPMVVDPIMIEMTSTKNTIVTDGTSPTLTARMGTGGNQVNAVCIGFDYQAHGKYGDSDVASTCKARDFKDATDLVVSRKTSTVRRLTPLECERLQHFPDGWTDIGEWVDSKGKKHKPADSPRYKALGNSIALPFWEYLARRICAQYERNATMGSLFDGIGGFPLAFSRCGAIPVWASEIEEFPIAVTKYHFPE